MDSSNMVLEDSKYWHFREKTHSPIFKALWKHVSTKGNPSGYYLVMVEREKVIQKSEEEGQAILSTEDDKNIELILIRSKPKEKSQEHVITDELNNKNEAIEEAKDWMDEYIYIKHLEESF